MARSTTPKLLLGVWDDGDNPGAGSKTIKSGNTGLNGNWLIIDDAVGTEHNSDGTHKARVIKAVNLNFDVVDGITLEKDPTTEKLKIKDGGVSTDKLADQSVTTAKIANLAVTREKIANGAVGQNQIDWGEVVIRAQTYVVFTVLDNDEWAYLNNVQTSYNFGFVIPSRTGATLYRMSALFSTGTKIASDLVNVQCQMGDVISVERMLATHNAINIYKNGILVYQKVQGAGQNFAGRGIITLDFITEYPD